MKNKKKVIWWKFYYGECPVCGSSDSYKEAQYTPKPNNVEERYEHIPDETSFDGCIY